MSGRSPNFAPSPSSPYPAPFTSIFEIDQAAAAAASSASEASKASVASALQASMADSLASRRAQGHAPPAYAPVALLYPDTSLTLERLCRATTTTSAMGTDSSPTAAPNVVDGILGAVTSTRRARTRRPPQKRHARDFGLEARDADDEYDDEDEAASPLQTAPPTAEIGKRCSGMDHGCEMTEEQLFK